MEEPVCLIESDKEGRLSVVPRAQAILDQIDQPVVVVAVVGLYRTGKSYLMNKLAGRSRGFSLGSTVQSKTKGIWMWCIPHPVKRDHTLVLLDTEGLGDVEKGDEKNDSWIFSMAVLLSSTLVYNSMGTIDNTALERLHYVTELTETIKIQADQDDFDDSQYVRFFPSFVWTVRDFTLKLELDGVPITANDYLDNALKLKSGANRKIQQYNLPRSCLQNYFSPRWCFVFERPANGDKMKRMEELTNDDLEPSFVSQATEFTNHIYNNSETKTLKGGIKVTGRILGNLAATYVDAIRSGNVPCLENAVEALSKIENAKAIEQAKASYLEKMMAQIKYPTESLEELSKVHGLCEKEALALFMKLAFRDDKREHQLKLSEVILGEYTQILENNIKESIKVSKQILQTISSTFEEKIRSGCYTVPGGYNKFRNDLDMMTRDYRSTSGKGVQAEEVLKSYLDEKMVTGQTILAADKHLTEAEKQAEEEKAKRERTERENQAVAERLKTQERLLADQKRAQEENLRQLMEKIERDNKATREEHQKMMKARDEELEKLRQKGYEEETKRLERQIEELKNNRQVEEKQEGSILGPALDTIGTGMMFLPGWGPVAGVATKFFSNLFR